MYGGMDVGVWVYGQVCKPVPPLAASFRRDLAWFNPTHFADVVVVVPEPMGVWACGCMGAWVHGCTGVWAHGCIPAALVEG